MLASPEPHIAVILLKGLTTTTLGTIIGAIIGPIFGPLSPFISVFDSFDSALGVFAFAAGAGSGFGGGGAGGSVATYLSEKSETMSLLAETRAFSRNEAS